jgi:hypothetical protein
MFAAFSFKRAILFTMSICVAGIPTSLSTAFVDWLSDFAVASENRKPVGPVVRAISFRGEIDLTIGWGGLTIGWGDSQSVGGTQGENLQQFFVCLTVGWQIGRQLGEMLLTGGKRIRSRIDLRSFPTFDIDVRGWQGKNALW